MRILVIEDDPDLLDVVSRALREEGYAIDTAANGEDGLYKATNWDYDAIVLDIMLPKMDGWSVLSGLRRVKSVPVLVLTAKDSVIDRVRGLDSGADDYLIKPFELAELRARLRAVIRRSAGQAHPVIHAGDVVIDMRSRNVTRNNRVVDLTAREYALVELLALHAGQLVTKTMIYEHLFGENDDSLSNLVEVHISNVRKKLGRDFIMTRRGHGYMVPEEHAKV